MRRGGGVHTVSSPSGKRWWNKVDGKVVSRHRTKETAVEAGRAIARKLRAEHTIHRSDGVITEANSYGNDPREIPG